MADERTSRLRLPALGMDLTELPLAAKAFIATAILVLIGGIAAPSTISTAAILSTLPYFAILAVASIGQHLVIQQRGLDLSTAGVMSFCAVVVTKLPDSSTDTGVVIFWIFAALATGALIGAITGLIVTLLQVPPLVTTIGVNAILFGLTYFVSTGASVQSPPMMVKFFTAVSLCAHAGLDADLGRRSDGVCSDLHDRRAPLHRGERQSGGRSCRRRAAEEPTAFSPIRSPA